MISNNDIKLSSIYVYIITSKNDISTLIYSPIIKQPNTHCDHAVEAPFLELQAPSAQEIGREVYHQRIPSGGSTEPLGANSQVGS